MTPGARILAVLIGMAGLSGCAGWQEQADARAFENCGPEADPEARRRCVGEARAAALSAMRSEAGAARRREAEAEERERLRKVHGSPVPRGDQGITPG